MFFWFESANVFQNKALFSKISYFLDLLVSLASSGFFELLNERKRQYPHNHKKNVNMNKEWRHFSIRRNARQFFKLWWSFRGVFRTRSNIQDGRLCENSQWLFTVNCFRKNAHLSYLIGFLISLCRLNSHHKMVFCCLPEVSK